MMWGCVEEGFCVWLCGVLGWIGFVYDFSFCISECDLVCICRVVVVDLLEICVFDVGMKDLVVLWVVN